MSAKGASKGEQKGAYEEVQKKGWFGALF